MKRGDHKMTCVTIPNRETVPKAKVKKTKRGERRTNAQETMKRNQEGTLAASQADAFGKRALEEKRKAAGIACSKRR